MQVSKQHRERAVANVRVTCRPAEHVADEGEELKQLLEEIRRVENRYVSCLSPVLPAFPSERPGNHDGSQPVATQSAVLVWGASSGCLLRRDSVARPARYVQVVVCRVPLKRRSDGVPTVSSTLAAWPSRRSDDQATGESGP